jgi:hypothetical protein
MTVRVSVALLPGPAAERREPDLGPRGPEGSRRQGHPRGHALLRHGLPQTQRRHGRGAGWHQNTTTAPTEHKNQTLVEAPSHATVR